MWTNPISHMMQKDLRSQSTYCILAGIYEAIRLTTVLPEEISEFDYTDYNSKVQHKLNDKDLSIHIHGIKSSRSPYYIVTEYAPKIFHHLRIIDNITCQISMQALYPGNNTSTLLSVHRGEGGSGSLFIFTEDNNFVIKTIAKSERVTLVNKLLENYHKHVSKNKDSILCRIYGVYTLRIPGLAPIELLLCQNLKKDNMIRFYDLKGSLHNRSAAIRHESFNGPFKDQDFLSESFSIPLNPTLRTQMLKIIYKDISFLYRHDIMDYSLFLQILSESHPKNIPNYFQSEFYHLAIIDYLSEYNYKKKAEYYIKLLKLGKKIKYASVMDPKRYFNRFFKFISEKLFRNEYSILLQNLS